MNAYTISILHCTEDSSQKKKKKGKKEIKGIQVGKKEVNLPLFSDDIKLYSENPKKYRHTLINLEVINTFSKVADC